VTVVGRSLSHVDRTSCRCAPGSRPLRPELAAPLGVWLSSQLAWIVGGCDSWRLCGGVVVLRRCISTGCGRRADRFLISPGQSVGRWARTPRSWVLSFAAAVRCVVAFAVTVAVSAPMSWRGVRASRPALW
jgi:hypothetical protein